MRTPTANRQPAERVDDLDMRALLDDTMTKLGVKTAPSVVAPPAPDTAASPTPPLTRQEQLLGAALGLVLLIIASILWSRWQAQSSAVPTLSPTPISVPTAAPLPTPPVAMLPAFAAPNEAPRWQIEATRTITPVAHYGSDWIQADVAGSGLIWLKARDWPALAIVGADLAPRKPAAAPAAPPAAIATPEPQPPCATVSARSHGTELIEATVCAWLSPEALQAAARAAWAEKANANIGRGDVTPTPDFIQATPSTSITIRQALIGSDPSALACQNAQGDASPLCAGLTNAEAQAALDNERAKERP